MQEWLLNTYGKREGFAKFVTDSGFNITGITGSNTMTALVYSLQYELGILEPTGAFGSITLGLAPIINKSNASKFSKNMIKILEGGLWCHGYTAGYNENSVGVGVDFGGSFDNDTVAAISELQNDIGLASDIVNMGEMTPHLWKALLSTDAFVTTWTGGSIKLQEAQQYLNWIRINGYNFACDFLGGYIPTDGLNSRKFSEALIYYRQAIMGFYASEATGNLGPQTQAGLLTIPENLPSDITTSKHYVRSIVFSLLANGYDVTINSNWSQETANVVKKFQKDMAIPQTGVVNYTTWMALLISYGDKGRSYTACDTRFEITEERLSRLKSMGIQAVGRYLTGTDFKVLRNGEVQRILEGGLGVIPIFQKNGTVGSDFDYETGKLDAIEARVAAIQHGIPLSSVIYFAVDYDPQNYEIENNIVPYFQGVRTSLGNEGYYVAGIYGTRNVCSKVLNRVPEIATSYVSNMSSGYSGNLGFKMPDNWTFDQFDEITIDDWGIDKVVYSGKHAYVTNDDPKLNYNKSLFAKNPIRDDDFTQQPRVYLNMGKTVDVYSSKGEDSNSSNPIVIGSIIGKIKTGQYFTLMGGSIYDNSRVIFTAENGKAAYGYVYNAIFAFNPDPILVNKDPFYCYNYNSDTGKLDSPSDLYTSPNPQVFTVKTPLKYYGNDGRLLGELFIGVKLYLEKILAPNGLYYGTSDAAKIYPNRMAFNKMQFPGGKVLPLDPENLEGFGWGDLGYSYGSLGSARAIF